MIFTEKELAVGCKCLTAISAGGIGKRDVAPWLVSAETYVPVSTPPGTAAAAHKPGDHQANRQPCST